MAKEVVIRRWDDWHAHLREGEILARVISLFKNFGRVVCMGNLLDKVDNLAKLKSYWKEILALKPAFEPIIGVMLTNGLTVKKFNELGKSGIKFFLKLIPGGTSFNSTDGVRLEKLKEYYPILEIAAKRKIPFLIHAELDKDQASGGEIPWLKREAAAIPFVDDVVKTFPHLIITFEHITTRAGVNYVIKAPDNVGASATPHHSVLEYSNVYDKENRVINPDNFCLPIAKLHDDRLAIIEAITSGNPKLFLGSDNAPHPVEKKQAGAPGIFNIHAAPAILCSIFDLYGKLENLEKFTSVNGARHYNLPLNQGKIKIKKEKYKIPSSYFGLKPFFGGFELDWKVQ
jgi:dihydroorotase